METVKATETAPPVPLAAVAAPREDLKISLPKCFVFKTSLAERLQNQELLKPQHPPCNNCQLRKNPSCYCVEFKEKIGKTASYQVEELQLLKLELQSVEKHLNTIDISQWQKHTAKTNPYSNVIGAIRQMARQNASEGVEMVTNGWVKLYEILSSCNLLNIPTFQNVVVKSCHLCECPGGFICATNHYVKSINEKNIVDWRAFTLNPHFEGHSSLCAVRQDYFYKETYANWLNGADDSGDIMKKDNIEQIWDQTSRASIPWMPSIVTADGSVSVQHDPASQESITAPIQFAELVCALGLLRLGGSFVLKMFTLFEHHSISIIGIMSMLFAQVAVVKPKASRGGNSEVYVLGFHFLGIRSAFLKSLVNLVSDRLPVECAIVPKQWIPTEFLTEFIDCASDFAKWQVNTISDNLKLWNDQSLAEVMLKTEEESKMNYASEYVEAIRLRPIPHSCFIVPRAVHNADVARLFEHKAPATNLGFDNRSEADGTLVERIQAFQDTSSLRELRKHNWMHSEAQLKLLSLPTTVPDEQTSIRFSHKFRTTCSDWFSLHVNKLNASLFRNLTKAKVDAIINIGNFLKTKLLMTKYTAPQSKWFIFAPDIEPYEFEYSAFVNDTLLSRSIELRHSMSNTQDFILPSDLLCKICPYGQQLVEKDFLLSQSAIDVLLCVQKCSKLQLKDFVLKYRSYFEICTNANEYQHFPVVSLFKKLGIDGYVVNYKDDDTAAADTEHVENLHKLDTSETFQRYLQSLPGPGRILGSTHVTVPSNSQSKQLDSSPRLHLVDATQKVLKGDNTRCHFAFLDVSGGDVIYKETAEAELRTKQMFVGQVLMAFKALEAGGDLLIRLSTTYTRFTAGIILVLGVAFDALRVIRPASSSPWRLQRYLFCTKFKDPVDSAVRRFLQYLYDGMWNSTVSCVQIIPPVFFATPCFRSWLTSINERLVEEEILDAQLRASKHSNFKYSWISIKQFLIDNDVKTPGVVLRASNAKSFEEKNYRKGRNRPTKDHEAVLDPWDGEFKILASQEEKKGDVNFFSLSKDTESLWDEAIESSPREDGDTVVL